MAFSYAGAALPPQATHDTQPMGGVVAGGLSGTQGKASTICHEKQGICGMDQEQLQDSLGYRFANPALLDLALTHSSWANENSSEAHNERMEFLGDAVLELCVSDALYQRFDHAREGDLTHLRSHMVNTHMLATLAREIGIDRLLRLGRGEEQQGGRQRDALLADAMEAVLGGVFLDGGFAPAQEVIGRLFAVRWPKTVEPIDKKDFKSRLQEATQRLLRVLPVYVLTDSKGPEHDKTFTVRVELPDGRAWVACAPSVKRAEHEAAKAALCELLAAEEKLSCR